MALAVPFSPPAMDGEQSGVRPGTGVHPFFTAQRGRSREPVDNGAIEVDGSTDGAGDLASGARKSQKTRKRSPEKGTQQSTLNFGQKPLQDRNDDQASEAPGPHVAAEVVDESQERRKRQRTQSLERPTTPCHESGEYQLSWEEQLIKAGFEGSSPAKLIHSTLPMGSPKKDSALATTSNVSEDAAVQVPVDMARGSKPKAQTPPKKIIKLRTDGKLVSPKVKDDVGKRASGKRKGGEDSKSAQRLVKLRYGSDDASRAKFGNRLEEILSRVVKEKQSDHHQQLAKLSVEVTQPKATHPFFMGKVARTKQETLLSLTQEDSDNATLGPERPSSPKRPAVAVKSSWAGFGASFTKPQRPLGVVQAIWPPKDMVHCRGPTNVLEAPLRESRETPLKKLKGSETKVEAWEDVLNGYDAIVSSLTSRPFGYASPTARRFHRPGRKLLTGNQLIPLVEKQLGHRDYMDAHPAIAKLFKGIGASLSAFDRFECENQEWAHKYAPISVEAVLCHDTSTHLLRDWIVGLTINSVNTGSDHSGSQKALLAKRMKARAKKKRKISDGLDDFIVSEDELGDADEVTDPEDEVASTPNLPRLSHRNIERTRAVILNGPHGCGKTALVYAAARELGFEVFEVNSGTRRSGRDIMDRVGDMTRNHLVRQLPDEAVPDSEGKPPSVLDTQAEVDSGRQSTMKSFFQAKAKPVPKKKKQAKLTKEPEKEKPPTPKKPARKQKQSLILLEEVDVLFEEDKQFWSTVVTLLLSSRRPVIMTCTDESMLPLSEMVDVAALRMSPPPEDLVIDYLLLIAATEGHLISREVISRLFHLSGHDLRASIAQLDFLCQMALGDSKGGLEWMLIRSNAKESQNEHGEALRVISETTFTRGMITLMPDWDDSDVNPRGRLLEETYLLEDVYDNWQLEPGDWIDAGIDPKTSTSIQALRDFEAAADGLSAADILPGTSFLHAESTRLDPTHPSLTEKERANYPTDRPLLDAPLATDMTRLTSNVVLSIQLLSRNLRQPNASLSPSTISSLLSNRQPSLSTQRHRHASFLSYALQPLTLPSPTFLGQTSPSRLPATLPRVLAADIAPYVRSIVSADVRLEETRLRLSGLLSEGSTDKKKTRTTRAARAALEGGRKESTRRERWYRREVNYRDVQRTGAAAWEAASDGVIRERERVKEEEEAREKADAEADEDERDEEGDSTGESAEDMISGEVGAKGQVNMELD